MDESNKGQEPINPTAGTAIVPETVTLTKAELDDLKHKAEVSSQNYARLKKAEEDLELLKSQTLSEPITEFYSDEGKALAARLEASEKRFAKLEEQRALEQVTTKYPVLADKASDFEEFRQQYPGYAVENVAKLFLVEKDLLNVQPQRKGLEKPTGGPATPTPTGLTPEDVARLRATDYQGYKAKLLSGEIKI